MANTARALGIVSLLVVAVACQRGSETPGATTTTAARPVGSDEAATRITKARCDREVACNNVGPGKHYEDRGACTRELEHDARATLRADECPNGVDETRLSTCVLDIANERCGNPIDTAERMMSCRRAQLCTRQ